MERRTSMNSDKIFSKPLLVYKISSEKAYKYALVVLEYLIINSCVNTVYVEDTDKINIEILIKILYTETVRNSNIEILKDFDRKIIRHYDKLTDSPDLCIVIGGDGTTLWTNHLLGNRDKPPFLNFNLGTLGYMAIYSCESINEVLEELFSNTKIMSFEKRATLNAKIYSLDNEFSTKNEISIKSDTSMLSPIFDGTALNDVILEKGPNTTMIMIKVYLNDEPLTVVKADGIIIATSTGSTAYNLSAGGSVIHYDVDTLILNAICPHSLSFRSIALPRDIILKLVPCSESFERVILNTDCTERITIPKNSYVEVSLSEHYCNFIVLEKFVKNRVSLWKEKIVDQLGWNNTFKNFG